MYKGNVIAIDIAKSVFQVCALDKHNNIKVNREIRRQHLVKWLTNQPPSLVALEACGSAHFWAKEAIALGHQAIIISARFAKNFLHGHKTDKNDAVAIGIAARQPNVKPINIKSDEQLALQACDRMRRHYQDCALATSNMIRSLLYEFGIIIAQGEKALREQLPEILEDAENGLPMMMRAPLNEQYALWLSLKQQSRKAEQQLRQFMNDNEVCHSLQKLEGIGPVNALGLYLTLGNRGEAFKNGREAAACIGLTPKQHSSGGKTVMLGISKIVAKKSLRANLIQGALAKVKAIAHRPPKNTLEAWVKRVVERRGVRRAAVALANKMVRIAWAMLHNQQPYRASQALQSS